MSEKPDLDLDFDDIVGKTETAAVEETKQETKVETKKEEPAKVTTKSEGPDYQLAFPTQDGKIKMIGLSTCSNEEFAEWVNFAWPSADEREPSTFDKREVRLRALKNIVRFHQSSLVWLRSQEKPPDKKKIKPN